MRKNRILKTAIALIVVGAGGIFVTTWLGACHFMGGGMNQDDMKEMMQEMMSGSLPPGIDSADLPEPGHPGVQLLNRYCTQCHNLPSPGMHTTEEWSDVEARMFSRMRTMSGGRERMGGGMMRGMMDIQLPSEEDKQTILSYLQRNALKPASLKTLGPPDTPGLALFKKTCSKCHALPDPKLHTTDEWPGTVARMRKNMKTMGKGGITDRERDEIVAYLSQQAR